jgi:hypothetical protein
MKISLQMSLFSAVEATVDEETANVLLGEGLIEISSAKLPANSVNL